MYPHPHRVQKIADMFLGKVRHHLEIRVPIFHHFVCMGITRVRIGAGIVKDSACGSKKNGEGDSQGTAPESSVQTAGDESSANEDAGGTE